MFEKQSHESPSFSWGGFGAVWGQTPRKAKETDAYFAAPCTLPCPAHAGRTTPKLQTGAGFGHLSFTHLTAEISLKQEKSQSSFFPLLSPGKRPKALPAYLGRSHSPSGDGQLSAPAPATKGIACESFRYKACKFPQGPGNPARILPVNPITLHRFPWGIQSIALELVCQLVHC